MEKEGIPAWLVCEDILTRVKDELILEAVDILRKEMKEGRIDIKGYVAALPDKGQELEQDLFMVNNLISNANDIRSQYKAYLEKESKGGIDSPEVIARGEGLRRFLMAVDAIEMLMHLSRGYGMWADDTGVYSSLKDPVDVMRKSAMLDEGRAEALRFVLSSKSFASSEALENDEVQVLEETYEWIKGTENAHASTQGHRS